MTEIKRYSLWLLPDDVAANRFAALIDDLSERYHGPRFAPHVTLLGRVTGPEAMLAETTERLARTLRVLTLQLQGFSGEAYYFRCFYAKLAKSNDLERTYEQASVTFKSGHASDYLPHLSLVYGQLPLTEKTRLHTEIKDALPSTFTVDRVQLMHITVAVAEWRAVVTCPLQPGA